MQIFRSKLSLVTERRAAERRESTKIIRALPAFDLLYHLNTLFLFTASDLKTIVIPSTIFGVLGSLAQLTQKPVASPLTIVERAPLVLLWTWLNVLPFNISNQRQPSAIKEDFLNKSWRPLPSRRLTTKQAKVLMLGGYTVATAFSLYCHGTKSCIVLMLLGWWYNDQNGAENCWIRNFINAAGYLSFVYGAVEVAIGSQAILSGTSCQWFLLIGGIIFSTVQIQDMPDQEGDKARGRRTLPLVIGDMPARWSIAVFVAFWSLVAPTFWRLGLSGYVLPVVLSGLIAGSLLWKRAVEDDKFSFKIWNVWVVAIYALPILKVLGGSS
ncbi:hypothetical protein N7G274_003371 [Stereocaulon virgatum]|uniref:UbiA prenyltransferase n=1 Tax=Stereocaulon virgatum TaxID=373712 RepID=A0ABR4AG89_9LECA